MSISCFRLFSVMVIGVGLCAPAMAAPTTKITAAKTATTRDPLVEGAMMCTRYFPRYEREYAIPTHLLSAIASTESGRYHEGLKIRLPWPWTVMSGGVGKFYDTKDEAVAAVKKLKASGVKNIDVGCMQVNLFHHADAFANVEQAFDPEYNVNIAATFLRQLYNDDKSWKQAASDYHSKTPALGAKYIGLVYDSWFNIIQKLREARMAVPASSLTAMSELKDPHARPTTLASAKVEPYPVAVVKPSYTAPHMNSIKVATVSHDTTPDALSYTRGVAVIRDPRAVAPMIVTPQPLAQITPVAGVKVADNSYTATIVKDSNPLPPVGAATQAKASVQPAVTQVSAPVTPIQSVALTQDGSHANASLSVPLTGITQAAVAPVTGIANAVLNHATDNVAQKALDMQMAHDAPASPRADADNSYTGRRALDTASVAYKSGPNFIFSE